MRKNGSNTYSNAGGNQDFMRGLYTVGKPPDEEEKSRKRSGQGERGGAARSAAMAFGSYEAAQLRRKERRQKRIALAAGLIASLLCGTIIFYGGMKILSFFSGNFSSQRVERVHIEGCGVVSARAVRNASQIIEQQTKMSEIDSKALQKKIEQIPWVGSVKVKKGWDAAVTITISEHKAAALMVKQDKDGQHLYYMDKNGRPFLRVRPCEEIDFPVVTGLSEISSKGLYYKVAADVRVFLRHLYRNNPQLPVQALSEIHITKEGELVLYLVEYPFPIFFGSGHIHSKYIRLVEVLKPLYKKRRGGSREIEEIAAIQLEYLQDKILVFTNDGSTPEKRVESQPVQPQG